MAAAFTFRSQCRRLMSTRRQTWLACMRYSFAVHWVAESATLTRSRQTQRVCYRIVSRVHTTVLLATELSAVASFGNLFFLTPGASTLSTSYTIGGSYEARVDHGSWTF